MKPFESGDTRVRWVAITFGILAALNVIAIISGFAEVGLIQRVIDGEMITETEALANDNRQALIGFAQTALYLVAAITFLVWIHRAYRNLSPLRSQGLRFSPGWAVGWFFVPIFSLFRPFQVVSEIWKASDPDTDTENVTAWKTAASSPIIGWWWAFFLVSNFAGNIAMRLAFQGGDPAELIASSYAYIASDCIDIVGFLITISLVRQINQRQEMKHALVARSPVPAPILDNQEVLSNNSKQTVEIYYACPQCDKSVAETWRVCPHCGELLIETA